MQTLEIKDDILRFWNEGFTVQGIMMKLGLSDEHRQFVENIVEDPTNYMTEREYLRGINAHKA